MAFVYVQITCSCIYDWIINTFLAISVHVKFMLWKLYCKCLFKKYHYISTRNKYLFQLYFWKLINQCSQGMIRLLMLIVYGKLFWERISCYFTFQLYIYIALAPWGKSIRSHFVSPHDEHTSSNMTIRGHQQNLILAKNFMKIY